MTCFWDSILRGIPNLIRENNISPSPHNLVVYLKNNNKLCVNVRFNGEILNSQRLQENFEAIRCFQEASIYHGYLCCIEDPFLFLISEIFSIDIELIFLNKKYNYNHISPKRKLHLHASHGHMSFLRLE